CPAPRQISFPPPQLWCPHSLYRSNPATLTPYEPPTSRLQCPSRSCNLGPFDAVTTEHRLNLSRITCLKGKGTRLASVKRKSEKLSRMLCPQAMDFVYCAWKNMARRSRAFVRSSIQGSSAPSARKNSSAE